MHVVAPGRLPSVDALRGLTVAAMLLVNTPGDWGQVYAPLLHAEWHGCTPADLVFPFFLFVVGVSIALGIVPRLEAGTDRATLRREAAMRALRIVGLGLLLHLAAWLLADGGHFRPWGVLQRIGLCFSAAAMVALYANARVQWTLIGALLIGYWALLAAGGSLAPFTNIASRIDTALLGPLLYSHHPATGLGHDPEGLPSTLPAIATTLLGLRAGAWLRAGRVPLLAGAAGLALLGGFAWSQLLPINKNLWTSSYVLWTASWALLALLFLHVLVDRLGWPALGRSLGRNAITVYVGASLVPLLLAASGWWGIAYRVGFAGWLAPPFGEQAASLAFALVFVALWWLLAWGMDRRGWRLRV